MEISKLYQKQSYPYGDCFSTCMACILGKDSADEVPNFMADGESKFLDNFKEWLEDNGLHYISVKFKNGLQEHPFFPEGYCILTGEGMTKGVYHSVVGSAKFNGDTWELFFEHDPIYGGSMIKEINTVGFLFRKL